MIRILMPLLAGLLLVLALPATAIAQQPRSPEAIEAATRQLATEMRCPVCQGVSIQDSPTELALEMKGVIRQRLESGETPEQVKAYFVDRYGEWILLRPEPHGFNLVVYILPVIGLLLGGGLVFNTVRKWTRPADDEPLPGSGAGRQNAVVVEE
jgi:cytochrome c-type biogenesis protein CcmH